MLGVIFVANSDGIDVNLSGAQELEITFRNFRDEVKGKVAKTALRAALKKTVFQQALENLRQLNNPATSTDISKNLMLRFNSKSARRIGSMSFSIGVRGGAKSREENEANPGGDTYYWRFVEFGTKHAKRYEPITRAAESQSGAFYSMLRSQMSRKIMLEARKQANRRASRSRSQNFRRSVFGLGD